jgi:hypothetical protein
VQIADIIKNGRTLSAKAAAAYATYQATTKAADKVADKLAFTWTVDAEVEYERYMAAKRVLHLNTRTLPGLARRVVLEEDGDGDQDRFPYRSDGWHFIALPGAPFMQAADNGSKVEFRAARKSDLLAAREAVDKNRDAATDYEFNPYDDFMGDCTPQTNILAWTTRGWDFRKARNARSFGSVILPAALQKEIEEDLRGFTESRDRLQRLEIPWRRGYLFEGPPGTGKTSLSLAIAGALGFNLASLSLTDIKSDGELRDAVSKLQPRTVLVIEDIDAYSVSRDRDHNASSDGALSLSGLLNSLDGFETPDGLVTVCTTNHVEQLDAALKRSGRLDRTFTLDYIDGPELERLFTWFYEMEPLEPAPAETGSAKMSPAEATELFKQNLDDPAAGWLAVRDRVLHHHLAAA